jgi:hypothetical protein
MEIGLFAILAIVFLFPPILAVWVLLDFRTLTTPVRWRATLACAILADWALLIAFHVLSQSSGFGKHYTSTRLADVFLLSSLLLLIWSVVSSVSRWKLSFAALLLLCFWVWTEQLCALRDDGSSLSVLITLASDKIDRSPRSSNYGVYGVLKKMANYRKRGYYDAAVDAGKAWTGAYPNDGMNDMVFIAVASSYLEKAQRDRARAEDYVHEALLYRDKALPIASDPAQEGYSTLRDLALISEYAGDLSPEQRCVQFGNTVKLYEHLIVRLKDKQEKYHVDSSPRKTTSARLMLIVGYLIPKGT